MVVGISKEYNMQKTIRLNEKQNAFVESQKGSDFSAKIRRIINEAMLNSMEK